VQKYESFSIRQEKKNGIINKDCGKDAKTLAGLGFRKPLKKYNVIFRSAGRKSPV